jgi:uncharacterized PurR-regulated membrane protein YhhQ (DUF165 family)
MFTLRDGDVTRGLITAIIASIFVVLYGAVMQTGFDVFTADWAEIGRNVVNAAVASFFGYIGKNFLTDSKGRVAGII